EISNCKPSSAGRYMRFAVGVLICCGTFARGVSAASDAPIQANAANLFVGEQKIVEGTVTAAQRDAGTVHLRLGQTPQDLNVSVVMGLLSKFPPSPERYSLGKTVRVAGMIHSFRGVPEIVVRDPDDIQVVEADGSDAARVPVAAPTPGVAVPTPGDA